MKIVLHHTNTDMEKPAVLQIWENKILEIQIPIDTPTYIKYVIILCHRNMAKVEPDEPYPTYTFTFTSNFPLL